MKHVWKGLISALLAVTLGYAAGAYPQVAADEAALEEWAYSLGLQAYVFGLPLIVHEREYALRTDAAKIERIRDKCPCAMINEMGHKEHLTTAADVMPYTPNNDTVYSGAVIDATDEPVILSLPDNEDRYWSVQVADPYTENTFYLGSRASGGKGGHYAFVAPGWGGQLPEGVTPHLMDYSSAFVGVRFGFTSEDSEDLALVNTLQRQVVITSLSNFWQGKTGQAPLPSSARNRGIASGEFGFFHTMASQLGRYPPATVHRSTVAQFELIGLVPGQPFEPDKLAEPIRRGLLRALDQGPAVMNWKFLNRGTRYSGWDKLPEGRYGYSYFARAAGAIVGLLVHDSEEAVYLGTFQDADGELLDGSKAYRIHFDADELPPVQDKGFWSLTMYGTDFQLVKNGIDRFSIGDRTRGLGFNEDGSLDLYIQSTPPEGRESNWLPSPASGMFRVVYRIYLPLEQARDPDTLEKHLPKLEAVE